MSEGLENRQYSSKPSAGALRAARAIGEAIAPPSTPDYPGEREAEIGLALIIDRETGVAELLEAAKEANQILWLSIACGGSQDTYRDTYNKLQQAIGKCERSE